MNKLIILLVLFFCFSCQKKNTPEALFTTEGSGCEAPCEITFKNYSENYIDLSWDFGDGNTDKEQSDIITHTYGRDGLYTVVLTVKNSNGEDSYSQDVTVVSTLFPVKSVFEIENNHCEASCTVPFSNLSEFANEYLWDFGDGETSTTDSPTHEYENSGSYSVSLEAIGEGGAAISKETVYINPPSIGNQPNANFTPSTINCTAPCTVSFENNSTNGVSYIWDFGDNSGEVSTPEPSNTYIYPGNYLVKLTAFDDDGNSHYTTRSIIVGSFGTDIPSALFLDKVEVIVVPNIDSWDSGGYPDLFCEISYSNDNGATWEVDSKSYITYDVKSYQLPVNLVCDLSLNFCEIQNWTALRRVCIIDNDGATNQQIGCVQEFRLSDFIGDELINFPSSAPNLRIYLDWEY